MPAPAVVGAAVGAMAAALFAVGAVLQHQAAAASSDGGTLDMGLLIRRPAWLAGQGATVLGTCVQVAALALAPVAVVQPMLAGALVVALGIRAVRSRCVPASTELLGAALTVGGLAVFLLAAHPRHDVADRMPGAAAVLGAVAIAALVVLLTARLGHGAGAAVACGAAGGTAAGIAAVLISAGIRNLTSGGIRAALTGVALWGAVVAAVVAQLGGQQAYARGSLAWSLPALTLCDPLAAVPAARLLLGERLSPGHAVVWLPAAAVAAVGVVLLARTSEGCRRPLWLPRRAPQRMPSQS